MARDFIGSNSQRVDGADKVTGKALYAADRLLPGMAFALPVTATIGRGRIRHIDVSKAEVAPGVVLVLTHLNMQKLEPLRFIFAGGHGSQSWQPLQSDVVAYRGQPVALIVAESVEAASTAKSLVAIDYETSAFSVELDASGGEELVQSIAAPYFPDLVAGDAQQALATAAVVVDETYTVPAQHHNAMELLSTVAEWQGDQLVVHEGTQSAQALCQGLAIQLNIDAAKVRVMSPYAGGGFGQRNSIATHTVLAAVAARRVGRPVKLVVPRDQIFHAVHFRPAVRHRVRMGATADGKFLAAVHEMRVQTSRFDLMPFTGAETTSRMYGFANFRSSTTLVKLDTQTPGFMRTPFESSSAVAFEGAIDALAYELDRDPVELRIANDIQADPISGKPLSSRRLNDCLSRGAERFGWQRRSRAPGSMRDKDGTLIGWGVACGGYPGKVAPALATVRLNADATMDLSVGGHEMGQGIRTAIALVAAEELGLHPQQIRITIGDTIAPPQHLTAGSWGTATATPAIMLAARDIRNRLISLASSQPESSLHGADTATLICHDGRVESSDGRGVAYRDVMKRAGLTNIVGEKEWFGAGQTSAAIERARQGVVAAAGPVFPNFVTLSYVAHFVEVRIDPRICRPRVSRVVSIVDCGRVVSRRTATSQVCGGVVWGVGTALSEQSEIDPRFGGFLNTNIAEYQIPVNADIGSIEVDFVDEPDTTFNAVGAKSLGEVASAGVAAAIANAVYHATGKRIRDLPIRIEDLL